MLYYRAPKSQLWGHRINRLGAVELLDRSEQFIRDHCIVEQPVTASFSVVWTPRRSPQVSAAVAALQSSLKVQAGTFPCTNRDGEPATELRWKLNDDDVRVAARWLDQSFEAMDGAESDVTLTKFVTFRWNEPLLHSAACCGGMFGFHLGKPRAITTMFAFESLTHYEFIKGYLGRIGLVALSDKRLKQAP